MPITDITFTDIQVIMGGGRYRFFLQSQTDLGTGLPGARKDLDLITAWQDKYKNLASAEYITKRQELLSLDVDDTDYLLGKFL